MQNQKLNNELSVNISKTEDTKEINNKNKESADNKNTLTKCRN